MNTARSCLRGCWQWTWRAKTASRWRKVYERCGAGLSGVTHPTVHLPALPALPAPPAPRPRTPKTLWMRSKANSPAALKYSKMKCRPSFPSSRYNLIAIQVNWINFPPLLRRCCAAVAPLFCLGWLLRNDQLVKCQTNVVAGTKDFLPGSIEIEKLKKIKN